MEKKMIKKATTWLTSGHVIGGNLITDEHGVSWHCIIEFEGSDEPYRFSGEVPNNAGLDIHAALQYANRELIRIFGSELESALKKQ